MIEIKRHGKLWCDVTCDASLSVNADYIILYLYVSSREQSNISKIYMSVFLQYVLTSLSKIWAVIAPLATPVLMPL